VLAFGQLLGHNVSFPVVWAGGEEGRTCHGAAQGELSRGLGRGHAIEQHMVSYTMLSLGSDLWPGADIQYHGLFLRVPPVLNCFELL